MSPTTTTPTVSPSIISDIDSILSEDSYYIVAYNNDTTPFNVVVYVLESVVPMSNEEAESHAWTIHFFGSSIVYKGSRFHCEKIGQALNKVQVQYEIFSNFNN